MLIQNIIKSQVCPEQAKYTNNKCLKRSLSYNELKRKRMMRSQSKSRLQTNKKEYSHLKNEYQEHLNHLQKGSEFIKKKPINKADIVKFVNEIRGILTEVENKYEQEQQIDRKFIENGKVYSRSFRQKKVQQKIKEFNKSKSTINIKKNGILANNLIKKQGEVIKNDETQITRKKSFNLLHQGNKKNSYKIQNGNNSTRLNDKILKRISQKQSTKSSQQNISDKLTQSLDKEKQTHLMQTLANQETNWGQPKEKLISNNNAQDKQKQQKNDKKNEDKIINESFNETIKDISSINFLGEQQKIYQLSGSSLLLNILNSKNNAQQNCNKQNKSNWRKKSNKIPKDFFR